jgi:hypothetical protein
MRVHETASDLEHLLVLAGWRGARSAYFRTKGSRKDEGLAGTKLPTKRQHGSRQLKLETRMNEYVIAGIVMAALAGVVAFFIWKRKAKKAANAWKENTLDRARRIIASTTPSITPAGHKVYFEPGTDKTTFTLAACDAGIERTFQKGGECAGYTIDRPRHRISIIVLAAEMDSQGDPAFRVYISNQNPYWNSEWDKATCPGDECDHYVLAAAQTIAVGDPQGDWIVVPHHAGREAHLSTVCEYEMEHVLLSYVDPDKYWATQTHGNGQGHPLIDDSCLPQRVGLIGREFQGLCAGAQGAKK